MIEFLQISIVKRYEPELSTLNEPDTFAVKDDNKRRVVNDLLADYLIEEFDKQLIKRMENYNYDIASPN